MKLQETLQHHTTRIKVAPPPQIIFYEGNRSNWVHSTVFMTDFGTFEAEPIREGKTIVG